LRLMSKTSKTELDRINQEFTRRDADPVLAGRYSLFNPAALLHRQGQERHSLAYLKKYKLENLSSLKILDVGCGSGGQLRRFLDYGADPANLYGVDMLSSRVEQAQKLAPAVNWQVASAGHLPFATGSFDLVLISVVLTSVLDEAVRREISMEIHRVLKPDGKILWFDFAFSNPRNRAVRGINRTRVGRLFPGAKVDLKRICLAPPLARLIAPRSFWLAEGLERLVFLNTHLLGIISFENELPA
jgi:ubiquinone/menaquinone biosynthesis C-methylase UbiE